MTVALESRLTGGGTHVFYWSKRKWCDCDGRASFVVPLDDTVLTTSSRVLAVVPLCQTPRYTRSTHGTNSDRGDFSMIFSKRVLVFDRRMRRDVVSTFNYGVTSLSRSRLVALRPPHRCRFPIPLTDTVSSFRIHDSCRPLTDHRCSVVCPRTTISDIRLQTCRWLYEIDKKYI